MSWNVLAPEYTHPELYPSVPAGRLDARARLATAADIIATLPDAIWCLQELSASWVDALGERVAGRLLWCPKDQARPDGCAVVVPASAAATDEQRIVFEDSSPRSGHVAQLVTVDGLTVANTHLRFSLPQQSPSLAELEMVTLIGLLHGRSPAVVCGDMTVPAGHRARRMLAEAGFVESQDAAPTARVNGGPAWLDVVAVRGCDGQSVSHLLPADTALTADGCPSDHVPVAARVSWTAGR